MNFFEMGTVLQIHGGVGIQCRGFIYISGKKLPVRYKIAGAPDTLRSLNINYELCLNN